MESVFLSYSFRPESQELTRQVRTVVESHDLRTITGEDLGGGQLTPEVMRRIEGCDALVALMTPRDELASGKYRTHPWVRDELNHARSRPVPVPAIALVDTRVDLEGAYQEHEYISYDEAAPANAFLKLMRTIGRWKRDRGQMVRVRISPEDSARPTAGANGGVQCQFRWTRLGQDPTTWSEVRPIYEEGGIFVYLKGVPRDSLFEIRSRTGSEQWQSRATAQYCHAELRRL